MFSLFKHLYDKLFTPLTNEICNEDEYLDKELHILEIENFETDCSKFDSPEEINGVDCFERTGTITFLEETYGLIDGCLYFEKDYLLNIALNDKVRYLASKGSEDTINIIKILHKLDSDWDNYETEKSNVFDESYNPDEKPFDVKTHVLIGKVLQRNGREVIFKDNLKINLEHVEATFIPLTGDWLEVITEVQWDSYKPCGSQAMQVIKVNKIKPLRTKVQKATVSFWDGENGILDQSICFNRRACIDGFMPLVGSRVIAEAIESDHNECSWRALSVISDINTHNLSCNENNVIPSTVSLEREKGLVLTDNLDFGSLHANSSERRSLKLDIFNKSNSIYKLLKWKLDKTRDDSQLSINPILFKPFTLDPNKTLSFTITCKPKYLGHSTELISFLFDGFEIERTVLMTIVDPKTSQLNLNSVNIPFESNTSRESVRNFINNSNRRFIPGPKVKKTPNFVPVRLGQFPIPNRLWNIMLDSDQSLSYKSFDETIDKFEMALPILSTNLTLNNYKDKWHTLLYLEEIQATITFRCYDLPKAFLRPIDEFLTVEFKGLAEKRPSLMCGDRVIARVMWQEDQPNYEGYIHQIKGDTVFIKFNRIFHEVYNGYDVSLEFAFSRGVFRRSHQAVNLALANLGSDILFPNSIKIHLEQKEVHIKEWFNRSLNKLQKQAVEYILKGTTRPMPYIIFGPPGTGKTLTLVEAVLQILTILPDSRILIATPSNSSANLITERLIDYGKLTSGSIIRIIANYLVESNTLPEKIRPYCATLDIATERTAKCNQITDDNGINLSCRSTFIGRHRITIGTCNALGVLALMELPRGHFTHVVIDEAGQAIEPEIMIPLTFLDKSSGQIILAGDPMQLGPVVMSRFANYFGLGESYLCRLLNRFPYLKDTESFKDGYDNRLITQLTYNYRSVPEVLKLPSEMFYGNTLVPQITSECSEAFEKSISDMIPNPTKRRGGIFFWGIRGNNLRAEDSPSWYNPQEAGMVLLQVCKLYKRNITADDIGIITPYVAQVRHLRSLFDSSMIEKPKIGSVEDFQGQERPIIIMTTVRSSEGLLETDKKFSLGFVNSPKRLNVALTRAGVAVFIVGNPHLLNHDHLWSRVLQYAISCNNYSGCDLPMNLQHLYKGEC